MLCNAWTCILATTNAAETYVDRWCVHTREFGGKDLLTPSELPVFATASTFSKNRGKTAKVCLRERGPSNFEFKSKLLGAKNEPDI